MALWSTSNNVLADTSSDTVRSRTYAIELEPVGLKPLTKYTFWLDGIDYSWACKPWGRDLGEDLVSDPDGKLFFTFLFDFQYDVNYSFDSDAAAPRTSGGEQYGYYTTKKFFELRGPGSYASSYFPFRVLVKTQ